jgi:hypothetical protein
MKDRLDTVRVYQSVNGDMTHLQDHYTIHGLEHLLDLKLYHELQRCQKQLVAAVVRAHRQKLPVETIRHVSLYHSAESTRRALGKAAGRGGVNYSNAALQHHTHPSVYFTRPAALRPPQQQQQQHHHLYVHQTNAAASATVPTLRGANSTFLRQHPPTSISPSSSSSSCSSSSSSSYRRSRCKAVLVTPVHPADTSTGRILQRSALFTHHAGTHSFSTLHAPAEPDVHPP